jgi:hypothetical protein
MENLNNTFNHVDSWVHLMQGSLPPLTSLEEGNVLVDEHA